MATVDIKAVRKVYPGGFEAIKGIDCAITDGELLVLLGPSGCGKSTLLRMVAGLETITEGDVMIGERVVNQLEPKDRNVAMVFQNYALYPHMSVFDNMAYGLKIQKLSKDAIRERVTDTARMLELEALLERKPRQLSGGQRQRVAMGRAIVREPAVFLFDEPLSNLDAKLRNQMRVEIKHLQRRLGVTALYVTHDQVEAMTLADRMMVMNAGIAEQIGTPMEIYQRPSTAFVAGFVGSPAMNFVEAQGADDRQSVDLPGGLRISVDTSVDPGRPVRLGMRPEHFQLSRGGDTGMAAKVVLVEALGADSLVHATVAQGGFEVIARVPGEERVTDGDIIGLTIAPEFTHLFDQGSGARVGG